MEERDSWIWKSKIGSRKLKVKLLMKGLQSNVSYKKMLRFWGLRSNDSLENYIFFKFLVRNWNFKANKIKMEMKFKAEIPKLLQIFKWQLKISKCPLQSPRPPLSPTQKKYQSVLRKHFWHPRAFYLHNLIFLFSAFFALMQNLWYIYIKRTSLKGRQWK